MLNLHMQGLIASKDLEDDQPNASAAPREFSCAVPSTTMAANNQDAYALLASLS